MKELVRFATENKLSLTILVWNNIMKVKLKSKKIPRWWTNEFTIDDTIDDKIKERLLIKKEQIRIYKSKPAKKRKNIDEMSLSELDKKLWPIYSRYIRLLWAKKIWWVRHNECYTTRKRLPINKLQAWHFISRKYKALKYNDDNVKPQSFAANAQQMWNGMVHEFEQRLIEDWVDVDAMKRNKNNKDRENRYYNRWRLIKLIEECTNFLIYFDT